MILDLIQIFIIEKINVKFVLKFVMHGSVIGGQLVEQIGGCLAARGHGGVLGVKEGLIN